MSNASSDFVVTTEHRRFAEFCDACQRYRYIGLCYGAPGVGKTLSARRYANWANIEGSLPAREASTEVLTALLESHTGFYTPPVVNTPAQVERDIRGLRSDLRAILVEDRERVQRAHLDELRQQERAAEEERQRRLFTEFDWYADPPPEGLKKPASRWVPLSIVYFHESQQIADPTTLVIIDEADRLKVSALEQVRAIFDKGGIGVVFIGMPGIEKRLSWYPQLYSRVGFVHAFRPLSAAQVRKLRLLHRLLTQIARLVEINALQTVTSEVVEAARESLVIGTA